MELFGYSLYGCTIWNISGVLQLTDDYRSWYLLLRFHYIKFTNELDCHQKKFNRP